MIKFDLAKWRQNQITETVKRGALNQTTTTTTCTLTIHSTGEIEGLSTQWKYIFLGFIIFEDLLRHRTSESYFEVFSIRSFLCFALDPT